MTSPFGPSASPSSRVVLVSDPASCLGARTTGLRLLDPPVQIGQLRLRLLQQRRLVP